MTHERKLMANHHITLVLEHPDGTTTTHRKPGHATALTDAELLANAEEAALADAPAGTRVIRQQLTR